MLILNLLAEGFGPRILDVRNMTINECDDSMSKKEGKAYLVLLLFRLLEKGEPVAKADFIAEYHASPRSFDRYIAEIRCYLLEQEPYLELDYERKQGTYLLRKPAL